MANKKMKPCKTCGEMIAKNAKVCPKCGAKQKGHAGIIIVAVVVIILAVFALAGGGNSGGSSSSSSKSSPASSEKAEEPVNYTSVDIADMMEALENNAAAANDEYKNQYLSVTGQLSNIDAQGSYIDIIDPDDEFAITGCQCYINGNEEIASIVKTLSKGDIITDKGKITDVGEVLGYSMTIDSIETE